MSSSSACASWPTPATSNSPSAWHRAVRTRSSGGRRCETASDDGASRVSSFHSLASAEGWDDPFREVADQAELVIEVNAHPELARARLDRPLELLHALG